QQPHDIAAADDLYEVLLKDKMRHEWKQELRRHGKIRFFRPPNILNMTLRGDEPNKVLTLPYVGSVKKYSIESSLTPDLLQTLKQSASAQTEADDAPQAFALDADGHDDGQAAPTEVFEVVAYTTRDLAKVRKAIG